MLSLIFRKKRDDQDKGEQTRVTVEAPVYMNVASNGEVIVDDKNSENQVVIEQQDDSYFLTTDINKVSVQGKQWILTRNKVEKLQTTLHEVELLLEAVVKSFTEKIPFKVSLDAEVKYVEEVNNCFNKLIEKHQSLNEIDNILEKAEDINDKNFPEFKKENLKDYKFEDYDRTGTIKDVIVALERKKRYLLDKKIMFLDMSSDVRLSESDITALKKVLEKLDALNNDIEKTSNKLSADYPELKVWRGLDNLDAYVKHFKKLLTEDRSHRSISPGEFISIGNYEIEVSNIIDPDKPHPWNRPFDPEITYKDVDRILNEIKNSDFAKESMLNYLKHRLGENFSEAEREEKEQELVSDIVSILPVIRNLIRFDCKVLNFSQGTKDKPEIICRKGDFGNSAYFIVSGKVEVLLDHEDPIPEEKLGKHKVKKKNLFQSIAQLLTNKHHKHEHRSYKKDTLTQQDHAIFIQDFDMILQNQKIKVVERFGAGNLFGEISAMGRTPRTATVVATEPAVLMEIRWQGLRDLRENLQIIKEITDANFRERGLDVHIRATQIFKDLSEYERKDLEKDCEFKSYGDFKWNMTYKDLAKKGELSGLNSEPVIVSQGDYPDKLYLIRSGFARVSRRFNNGNLTENYLGKGAIFGLEELKYNYENPHDQRNHKFSLTAIGYLDAIEVPKQEVIKHVFQNDPQSKNLHDQNVAKFSGDLVIHAENEKITSLSISDSKVDQGLIESLVGGRFVNGTKTMLINMDRCTRCDDCVVACSNSHNGNPRFIRHGRKIDNFMVANACMHCNDPVCMIGCPTGAISRNTDGGQVLIQDSTCIGCSTCANSCPYDNIRMVEYIEEGSKTIKVDPDSGVPLQKATKCDLCIDQPTGPACQQACPHDALKRVDLSEIKKVEQWLSTYKS